MSVMGTDVMCHSKLPALYWLHLYEFTITFHTLHKGLDGV